MNDQVKSLFDKARTLNPDEREELALLLLETLPSAIDHDRAWAMEARRRLDQHRASGDPTVDAFEALVEARRDLKRRREP